MPANALKTTKRSIESFSANRNSGQIDISGSYNITVKNTGITPVPSVVVDIKTLSPVNGESPFISDKTKNVGWLPPGESSTVKFSFNFTDNVSRIQSVASSGCNGNKIKLKVNELTSGLILAISTDSEIDVPVSANSCSLQTQEDQVPEEPGQQNDRPGQGNDVRENPDDDDVDEPRDPPEDDIGEPDGDGDGSERQPPEDDPGGPPDMPIGTLENVSVDGPEEVEVGESNTWTATPLETRNQDVYYEFDMGNGDARTIGEGSQQSGIEYQYSNTGNYEIIVRMFDPRTGDEIASDMQSVNVTDTNSSGNSDQTDEPNLNQPDSIGFLMRTEEDRFATVTENGIEVRYLTFNDLDPGEGTVSAQLETYHSSDGSWRDAGTVESRANFTDEETYVSEANIIRNDGEIVTGARYQVGVRSTDLNGNVLDTERASVEIQDDGTAVIVDRLDNE
jgi:hypothetical protein